MNEEVPFKSTVKIILVLLQLYISVTKRYLNVDKKQCTVTTNKQTHAVKDIHRYIVITHTWPIFITCFSVLYFNILRLYSAKEKCIYQSTYSIIVLLYAQTFTLPFIKQIIMKTIFSAMMLNDLPTWKVVHLSTVHKALELWSERTRTKQYHFKDQLCYHRKYLAANSYLPHSNNTPPHICQLFLGTHAFHI